MFVSSFGFSIHDQDAVHLRMELRRAALRGTVVLVPARLIDLERDRLRGADHRSVDENVLVVAVEREAVAGAETVVGRREIDPHDLTALDVDLRRLVLPGMLAQGDDAVRSAEPRHAPSGLALLVPRS